MSDAKLTKCMTAHSKAIAQGKPRELIGNIWEDVTVKIGRVYSPSGRAVDFDVFKEWTKVSFALNQTTDVIRTKHGDLILDAEFTSRMYLKGLFLGDSSTFKNLKFGYNLAEGKVNRDRQRLVINKEEAKNLANIWAEAIQKKPERSVKEYVKMLKEDDERQWADVNRAEELISKQTAKAIWKHLQKVDVSHEVFYCNEKLADEVYYCPILHHASSAQFSDRLIEFLIR
jgi:hypothetical protein